MESAAAQIPILTRVSPRVTPTNLFPSVLQEDSHTPTPPQLLTVETSHLFKPIMPDMNTTFDKEEGKIIFALLMNVPRNQKTRYCFTPFHCQKYFRFLNMTFLN